MNLRIPVPVLAAAALAALAAGCSSDLPNEVGSDLATVDVDSVLVPLDVRTIGRYSALAIEDPDVPLSTQQVLYLGEQQGTRSSILVNFDFDYFQSDDFPSDLWQTDTLDAVKLSLTRLTFYGELRYDEANDTIPVPAVSYRVYELDAPFDSTAFPGPVPAHDAVPLYADIAPDTEDEPQLELPVDQFLDWVAAGGVRGFLIEAGAESDPVLVGLAARDLKRYAEIPAVAVGTIPGPNFILNFRHYEEEGVLAPSVADISTFDQVSAPPASPDAHFLLRTHLRDYPALWFDLSRLPSDIYINRAVLVLHNDVGQSFGTLQTLVVSELDTTFFGDPFGSLTLDELDAAAYPVTGTYSNDPTYNVRFDFNVTASVQRAINGAYTGVRGFVLTADEDGFPAYDTATIDPDFYFNEFRFFGTAAADSAQRPHLLIHYSRLANGEAKAHD